MRGALYVERSANRKISGDDSVDATYASIKNTCPDTCSLKGEGCYAQTSYVGMINARMNKRARQDSPLTVARAEARAIDQAYGGRKIPAGRALRLHVSGDSRVRAGSRSINAAVGRWKKRGGGNCWSYTHSWANVPRKIWTNVSILASIDNVGQVAAVRKMGYAPALVIVEHPSEKVYTLPGSDVKWIPCVQQTRGVSCVDCKLCFNADRLFDNNMGIAFAIHGVNKNKIKRRLTVVQ